MQLNASKSGAIRHLGTALAATVIGLSAPAFAQQPLVGVLPHTLVITENSSSSLTVVYDGNPITPTGLGSDHWQFTLPDLVHLGIGESSPGAAIPEPEAVAGVPGPWNNVFTSTSAPTPFVNLVDVVSDSKTTDAFALAFTDNAPGLVGFDSNQRAIVLTFHDAGDGSGTVPDSASTGALAIISLISLFVIGRLRLVQTC